MNPVIRVASRQSVEWYDGFVAGRVVAGDQAYLVAMLAFDPSSDRRRFVMLPDTDPDGGELDEELLAAQFHEALARVVQSGGQPLLTRSTLDVGTTVDTEPFPLEFMPRLQQLKFPCIDRAVSEEARRDWL
jgi:hypothetical protein